MSQTIKKTILPLIIVAVVLGCLLLWAKNTYNALVIQDEAVKTAWSQVENQYQRRADLIPNLVNTVKGYANHERATLESVIEARAKATSMTISADQLTPEKLQQFQAAQGELSGALSRLMVVMERYPELKAGEQFRELQAQLEGTENRIAVERKRFNETAQNYNIQIRSFPASVFADMMGFEQRPYFTAPNAQAPVVDFSGQKS